MLSFFRDENTVVVTSLDALDLTGMRMPILTIYRHPRDFPDKYVVRLFDLDRPTNIVMLFDQLEDARAAIPPRFVLLKRRPDDDPVIVETYL